MKKEGTTTDTTMNEQTKIKERERERERKKEFKSNCDLLENKKNECQLMISCA